MHNHTRIKGGARISAFGYGQRQYNRRYAEADFAALSDATRLAHRANESVGSSVGRPASDEGAPDSGNVLYHDKLRRTSEKKLCFAAPSVNSNSSKYTAVHSFFLI